MNTMKFIMLFTLLLPLYAFQGEPKLCMNCKYFKKFFLQENRFGKCALFPRETKGNDYLVDGKTNPQTDYYCSTARLSDSMCGVDGYFFVKRNTIIC